MTAAERGPSNKAMQLARFAPQLIAIRLAA